MKGTYKTIVLFSILLLFGSAIAYIIKPVQWELVPMGLGLIGLLAALLIYKEKVLVFLRLRSTHYGTNTAALIIIMLGLMVMVNFIAYRHPQRIDLTETGLFTLSEQTTKVLKNLKNDVKIIAFTQEGTRVREEMEDIFKGYRYKSSRVSYEFFDPELKPDMAQRYNITQMNTVIVISGDNQTKITDMTEEALTNAVIKVTRQGKKKIYFTDGHGERDIEDSEHGTGFSLAGRALRDQNYEVAKINLSTLNDMPEDASLLIIADPEKPFLQGEIGIIERYLASGGKALVMLDQYMSGVREDSNIIPILGRYGVEIGANLIIDRELRLFAGPALGVEPLVASYGNHQITEPLKGAVLLSVARSVDFRAGTEGTNGVSLARTSRTSWGETDLGRLRTKREATDDSGDKKGPVSVAVAVSKDIKGETDKDKKEMRLVVIGDADFANNRLFNTLFNGDLFLNSVNWLSEETDLISIKPKQRKSSRIFLTADQKRWINAVLVIIPVSFVLTGFYIWRRRRAL